MRTSRQPRRTQSHLQMRFLGSEAACVVARSIGEEEVSQLKKKKKKKKKKCKKKESRKRKRKKTQGLREGSSKPICD